VSQTISSPRPGKQGRKGRPPFGVLVAAAVGYSVVRGGVELAFGEGWGDVAGLAVFASLILWRVVQRKRVAARGGIEHTPEQILQQIADAAVLPPAFDEDGTILGASIVVLNQRPKILEVETQYEVFASDASPLGVVTQIGQSGGKQAARVLTQFDQYFTHHFEVRDTTGRNVLRLTRPRKLFRSRMRVFDGNDRYLGEVQQENIFWKIRFRLVDAGGRVVGHVQPKNVRAWDWTIVDERGGELATVVKTWEGWAKTAWTKADNYVMKVARPLPDGLRELVAAVPLTLDVALKQDARGLG
jgi:hypothetical protein